MSWPLGPRNDSPQAMGHERQTPAARERLEQPRHLRGVHIDGATCARIVDGDRLIALLLEASRHEPHGTARATEPVQEQDALFGLVPLVGGELPESRVAFLEAPEGAANVVGVEEPMVPRGDMTLHSKAKVVPHVGPELSAPQGVGG